MAHISIMYNRAWTANPIAEHMQKVREKTRKGFRRVLPCYRFALHHKLKAMGGDPHDSFEGNGTFIFPDGRCLTFTIEADGLLIARTFIAPTPDYTPSHPLTQTALAKWDDIPATSAHQDIGRRAAKPEHKTLLIKGVSDHLHFLTPHYSLYLIWTLGGDISLNITQPETINPKLPIPTRLGLGWMWKGEDLDIIHKWYTKTHPYKMLLWEQTSVFSILASPLISILHSLKKETTP